MTLCIAALASDGLAIVCLADKSMSLDDGRGTFLSWDSDGSKIIPIGDGRAVALIAGRNKYIT
jgi:hypothetical protein